MCKYNLRSCSARQTGGRLLLASSALLWSSCIIRWSFDPQMDFGIALLEHFRARMRLSSSRRTALVFLAVCALTVSVATRYTVLGSEGSNVSLVKAHSADAKRQHLLGNGLQWSAPASGSTLFQPPRSSVLVVSAVFQSTNLCSEIWLYNRPPPNC